MTGTIKRLISDKGFGFVRDEAGREFFFHRSEVSGRQYEDLREGDSVTFEEAASAKGPRATNVVKT